LTVNVASLVLTRRLTEIADPRLRQQVRNT
jgi:hypothetical protein